MKTCYLLIICFAILACSSGNPADKTDRSILSVKTKTDSTKCIAILPFQGFDTALITVAKKEIKDFYQMEVVVMDPQQLPENAWYAQRSRYRADTLLTWLAARLPKGSDHILGLTNKDISCTKGEYLDWGIFGYGCMPGPSCVVSTFRLKKNNAEEKLFHERFAKVILHELGHNFGLEHCPTEGCMMSDANGTIVTVDNEKKMLCDKCREKLMMNEK